MWFSLRTDFIEQPPEVGVSPFSFLIEMAANVNENPSLPDEVEASLKCCECGHFLHPPIRMCDKGHNTCDDCKKKAKNSACPVCKGALGDNSNAKLEALIKHFMVSVLCENHDAGCTEEADLSALLSHEEDCALRSITCVIPSCGEEHMDEKHRAMSDGKWVAGTTVRNLAPENFLYNCPSAQPAYDKMLEYMKAGTRVVTGKDWKGGKGIKEGTVEKVSGINVSVRWDNSKEDRLYTHQMGYYGAYSHLIPRDHGFSASRKQA